MSGTAQDVLEIARSQLGVSSGQRYFEEMGDAWWGQPWCARFGRWVYWKAGVDCHWPYDVAFDERDVPSEYRSDKSDLQPAYPLCFDWDWDGKGDHFGIVESVQDWGCVTLEGNAGNPGKVRREQRLWENIICGIRPTFRHAQQDAGEPKNDLGMRYRAHTQNVGWLATVHDGQTAGITGESLRMEAVAIEPPAGVVLDAFAHVQDVGTLGEPSIEHGHARVLGTTGRGKRLEAVMLRVVRDSIATKGHPLRVQAHVQDVGWLDPVGAGEWAGTIGESRRLEALRIWFE